MPNGTTQSTVSTENVVAIMSAVKKSAVTTAATPAPPPPAHPRHTANDLHCLKRDTAITASFYDAAARGSAANANQLRLHYALLLHSSTSPSRDCALMRTAEMPQWTPRKQPALPTSSCHPPRRATASSSRSAGAEYSVRYAAGESGGGGGGDGTAMPIASPLFADATLLAKLPPMLIVVGDAEVMRDESVVFAARVEAAQAAVQAGGGGNGVEENAAVAATHAAANCRAEDVARISGVCRGRPWCRRRRWGCPDGDGGRDCSDCDHRGVPQSSTPVPTWDDGSWRDQ